MNAVHMKTTISEAPPRCRPGAKLNALVAGMLLLALMVAGVSVLEYELLDALLPVARVGVVLLTWTVALAVFASAITRVARRVRRPEVPTRTAPCS